MATKEISMSLVASALTQGVLKGQAPVAGVAARTQAQGVNTNSLEMLDLKYDVAEMSLATFTKAREQGIPLVALPIFPGRRFMQTGAMFRAGAHLRDLGDLRGKRVGLPQFWMTSSVWHRLVLHREYGVAQHEVSWLTMAPERMGSLGLPSEARQETSGRSARELLLAGELDATLSAGAGPRGGEAETDPRLAKAFPDPAAAQREYYERTRIFPIVHLIVMKEELANQEPRLVETLCNAFLQAKELGRSKALQDPNTRPIPGLDLDETQALFGPDPWPYGIDPNRPVLKMFLEDVREQGLIARDMAPEDLFTSTLPSELR